MPKIKTKKDRFDDLPEEFKTEIMDMSEEDIRKRISVVALNQAELMAHKKEDKDLIDKREQYKIANEPYAYGTKQNKLKIDFARVTLASRGKL